MSASASRSDLGDRDLAKSAAVPAPSMQDMVASISMQGVQGVLGWSATPVQAPTPKPTAEVDPCDGLGSALAPRAEDVDMLDVAAPTPQSLLELSGGGAAQDRPEPSKAPPSPKGGEAEVLLHFPEELNGCAGGLDFLAAVLQAPAPKQTQEVDPWDAHHMAGSPLSRCDTDTLSPLSKSLSQEPSHLNDTLAPLSKSLSQAPARRTETRNYQSETGRLRPGLEQYAAPLNCEEVIEEFVKAQFQTQTGSPSPLSDTIQRVVQFCFAVTGLGHGCASLASKPSTSEAAERRAAATVENPFAGLPDGELARLGAEEGLFSGLAETLAFLYKEYVQEPAGQGKRAARLPKRMAAARNFFARAVVRMRRNGQARAGWAEGPSEIQWWELLHQILLAERKHKGLDGAASCAPPSDPGEPDQGDTEAEEVTRESEALQLLHNRIVDEMPKDAPAGASAPPCGSDAALAYFKELAARPELAAELNRGSLGPRILTAQQWTYTRNVLFELLGVAGTMEVWGPSSARLEHETLKLMLRRRQTRRATWTGGALAMSRAAADPATLGVLPEQPATEVLSGISQTSSDEHVSLYSKAHIPRVVLSERMLLLQLGKRGLGRLTQHQLCKRSDLALALWVSREAHEEEVLSPLGGGAAQHGV